MKFKNKETKLINFMEDFSDITESRLDKTFACDSSKEGL